MSLIVAHLVRTPESSVCLWWGPDWKRARYNKWGLRTWGNSRFLIYDVSQKQGRMGQNGSRKSSRGEKTEPGPVDGEKETQALMIEVIHSRPASTPCDLQPENPINTKWDSLLPPNKIYNKNSQPVLSVCYNILLFRSNGTTWDCCESVYEKASKILKNK